MRLARNERRKVEPAAIKAGRGGRLRLATSLLVAALAYLGLIFGGNFVVNVSRGLNALSSAQSKELPQQLTGRDGIRAILASERKPPAKGLTHEPAPALGLALPLRSLPGIGSLFQEARFEPLLVAQVPAAYASRAPPRRL